MAHPEFVFVFVLIFAYVFVFVFAAYPVFMEFPPWVQLQLCQLICQLLTFVAHLSSQRKQSALYHFQVFAWLWIKPSKNERKIKTSQITLLPLSQVI